MRARSAAPAGSCSRSSHAARDAARDRLAGATRTRCCDASSALPLTVAVARRARRRASGAPSPSRRRTSCGARYPELAVALPDAIALCAVPLLAGGEVLGRRRRQPQRAARLRRRRARAAGGARPPGRAGARARAAVRPPAPPAGHDRRAGAGADAAGGRGDRGRAGRGGARRQQRVGGAARRGRAHARARARRRARRADDAAALRLASRSTPSCRSPHAARTVTPLWLESPEAIFGPYPRFAEVRPQAQAAALLPLSDDGRGARRDRARLRPRARLPAARPRLPAGADAAVRAGARPGAALPGRARPGGDAPAGAAARVAAAGGRAGARRPLPAGRRRRRPRAATSTRPSSSAAGGSGSRSATSSGTGRRPPRRWASCAARCAPTRSRAARPRACCSCSRATPTASPARAARRSSTRSSTRARASCATPRPGIRRRCWSTAAGETRFLEGARGVPLDRSLGFVYEDAVAACPSSRRSSCTPTGRSSGAGSRSTSGMERLAGAASAGARLEPDALCDALLDALIDGSRGAARRRRAARRPRAAAASSRRCTCGSRRVRTSSPWCARRCGRGWRAPGWRRATRELVVLAAGELCANSVEHAYPPGSDAAVEVALAREPGGVLTLVVRDRGRWRPPPADPGDRGRGLGIVRALMHTVDVDPGGDGTTVSVRYRPGAAPPAPAGVVGPPHGRGGARRRRARRASAGRDRPLQRGRDRAGAAGARARAGDRRPVAAGVPVQRRAGGAVRAGQAAACGSRSSRRPARPSGARWKLPSCHGSRTIVDSVHLALEDFARP